MTPTVPVLSRDEDMAVLFRGHLGGVPGVRSRNLRQRVNARTVVQLDLITVITIYHSDRQDI